MAKIDLIKEINALELEGVRFEEDTKTTIPELKLVLKGAGSDAAISALKEQHKTELQVKDGLVSNLEKSVKTEAQRADQAENLVQELNLELENKEQEIEDLKLGKKKVTLPVVEFEGKKYRFADPSFILPKLPKMTAIEAQEKPDLFPELIKRGVLLLEKEA